MKAYESAIFISTHQAGCISEAQSWEKMIRGSTQEETMESAWSKEVWLLCKFRLVPSREVLFKENNAMSEKTSTQLFWFLLD